ncbi:MAG: glycine cleavage system protein H [Desulfobacterales bacterium]
MEDLEKKRRSRLGYGSTYRKESPGQEPSQKREIDSVLGGQVWKITPDKGATSQNPCIWMQAGVVEFKNCNNYYDCTTCKYDQGMALQVQRGKRISWQEAMAKKPGLERLCRHSLTNRIGHRVCAYDYHCRTCDFDQLFEDILTPKITGKPHNVQQIKGFRVPEDYYFHEGHAWAKIESGGTLRVGLDDFALKILGKADALDLPLMGHELNPGKPGWGLKRKNKLADVLAPVGGVILETNAAIRENPEQANDDPYGGGWLFLVHTPDIKKSVGGLMVDSSCFSWINREVETLETMIEAAAGPLAADGGFLGGDVYGNVPEVGWENLTRTFLKT